MKTEIFARDDYRLPRIITHESEMLDSVGRLAAAFVEKWGMVVGEPDGEDSAGRAKLKLSSTANVLNRAYDFAEGVYAMARERGHLVEVPPFAQLEAEAEEFRKRN